MIGLEANFIGNLNRAPKEIQEDIRKTEFEVKLFVIETFLNLSAHN
jgi:hypothetical protein